MMMRKLLFWLALVYAISISRARYKTPTRVTLPRPNAWTVEQLNRLVVLRCEGNDWPVIASSLHRTEAACVQRYHSLIKLQRWSQERVERLTELVVIHGEMWKTISPLIGFTPDSCRIRYLQFVRGFNFGPWSEEEDIRLMEVVCDDLNIITINATASADVDVILANRPVVTKATKHGMVSLSFKDFATKASPPRWRRISHLLQRSTVDCRRRLYQIAFDIDLSSSQDVWFEGESRKMMELSIERGLKWSEIGRELGRSAIQCHTWYMSRDPKTRAQAVIDMADSARASARNSHDNYTGDDGGSDGGGGGDKRTAMLDNEVEGEEEDSRFAIHRKGAVNTSSSLPSSSSHLSADPIAKIMTGKNADDADSGGEGGSDRNNYGDDGEGEDVGDEEYNAEDKAASSSSYVDFSEAMSSVQGSTKVFSSFGPFFKPAPLSASRPSATSLLAAYNRDTNNNNNNNNIVASANSNPSIHTNTAINDASPFGRINRPHFGRQKSRKWSKTEDVTLMCLVKEHGNQWRKIGDLIGRPGVQCFQRHSIVRHQLNCLLQSSTRGGYGNGANKMIVRGWTDEQNVALVRLVGEKGPKWTEIGASLNRTAYVCQAAYKRLVHKSIGASVSLGGSSVSVIARGGEGGSEGGHTSPQLLLQQPTPQPPLPLPTLRVSRRMQLLLASQHLNGASARLDRDLDDFDYDSGGGDDALSVSTIDHIDDGQKGLVGTSASISYQTSSSSVWSKSDDELLKSLVLHLGRRWSSIAEIVGRSPEDVMLRYDFKIAPRRLGSWSKEEDRRLLELVNQWIVPELLKQNDVPAPLDYVPGQGPGPGLGLGPESTLSGGSGSGSSDGEGENAVTIGSSVAATALGTTADGGVLDLDQEKEKPCSWARIGAAIGRTGPQCRMRYHLSLDPRLKWRLWTDVEDDQLLGLRARGYNWAMVSAVMDRSASACRYRFLKKSSK